MPSLDEVLHNVDNFMHATSQVTEVCNMICSMPEIFDPEIRFVAAAAKSYSSRSFTALFTCDPRKHEIEKWATEMGSYCNQLCALLQERHPDMWPSDSV